MLSYTMNRIIPTLFFFRFPLFAFASLSFFSTIAEAAAPVATDDTYVVDVDGTLTVRASFPDTMTAQDPSLYWRFNDTANFAVAATIDRSDSLSSSSFKSRNSAISGCFGIFYYTNIFLRYFFITYP